MVTRKGAGMKTKITLSSVPLATLATLRTRNFHFSTLPLGVYNE